MVQFKALSRSCIFMLYKELDASLEAFVKNIILLENTGELGLWNVCNLDYELTHDYYKYLCISNCYV